MEKGTLSFFGISFGDPSFAGIGIDHEGIGWGLLIGTLALKRKLGAWFLPLLLVGFVLIISEPLFVDFYGNPVGSFFSVNLGLVIAILWSWWFGRRKH